MRRLLFLIPPAGCQSRNALALAMPVLLFPHIAAAQSALKEITDENIRLAIEDALQLHPGVDAQLVDVAVSRGIVDLSGFVGSIPSRTRAGDIAEATMGVRSVENRLQVRPVERSDDDLRLDVLAAIKDDPALSAKDVEVSVEGGRVRLGGGADSVPQKQLYSEAVGGVRGVRDVDNQMQVLQSLTRDDNEIAREIELRLLRNAWTQDAGVSVQVRSGLAKLSGRVNSVAQKRMVEEAAHVRGVKTVDSSGLEVYFDPAGHRESRVKLVALRDPQVVEAVKSAVDLDERLVNTGVEVEANAGKVTLSGEVPSYLAKRAAEEDALQIVGVAGVDNRLSVRPASGLLPDDELKDRVNRALKRSSDTGALALEAGVRNGKVTLTGSVDSRFQRDMTEAVVAGVDGVVALESQLKITKPTGAPDDAKLKKAIEERLWWNPFVDPRNVTVAVRGGEATITGDAPFWTTRQLIDDLTFSSGAGDITNHVELRPR